MIYTVFYSCVEKRNECLHSYISTNKTNYHPIFIQLGHPSFLEVQQIRLQRGQIRTNVNMMPSANLVTICAS